VSAHTRQRRRRTSTRGPYRPSRPRRRGSGARSPPAAPTIPVGRGDVAAAPPAAAADLSGGGPATVESGGGGGGGLPPLRPRLESVVVVGGREHPTPLRQAGTAPTRAPAARCSHHRGPVDPVAFSSAALWQRSGSALQLRRRRAVGNRACRRRWRSRSAAQSSALTYIAHAVVGREARK